MSENYTFSPIQNKQFILSFIEDWRKSLTAPQDGMWESFTDQAQHWIIQWKDKTVGYACVNPENCLLQFYINPQYLDVGVDIFETFIRQEKISKAIIGTNNPICLSLSLHFSQSVQVHTYLFKEFNEVTHHHKDQKVVKAKKNDLLRLIAFCNYSVGAPEQWLKGYLGDLIDKGEVFMLENGREIIGTCEVRKSASNPDVADLGIIVSPDYRRAGWGTFLLAKAREIAIAWNKSPICSCEKDNLGSLRAIQNNGFRSIHRMLFVEF